MAEVIIDGVGSAHSEVEREALCTGLLAGYRVIACLGTYRRKSPRWAGAGAVRIRTLAGIEREAARSAT